MADSYTEALDPESPADDDDVEQGDDAMRQFKRAMIVRLLTFFRDLDANPLEVVELLIQEGWIADEAITPRKLQATMQLRSIIRVTVSISDTVAAGAIGGGAKAVPGAALGDTAYVSWADGRFVTMAYVSAADVVTVSYGNYTAGSITLAAKDMLITVIKNALIEAP